MTTSYIVDKASKYFIAMLVGALIMLLLFRSCEPEKTTVTTPTVTGTIKDSLPPKYEPIPLQPKQKYVYRTVTQQLIRYDTIKFPNDTVYVYQPIDTLRTVSFTKPLEDEHVKITAKGIVTGRLEGLMLDYKLKPQKVAVPSLKWHIKAGGEIGSDGQRTAAKANLFYESRKGNEIQFGYDTERRYWIGGNLIIF